MKINFDFAQAELRILAELAKVAAVEDIETMEKPRTEDIIKMMYGKVLKRPKPNRRREAVMATRRKYAT